MPSVSRRYASSKSRFERPSTERDDETRAPVVLMVSGGADSTALLVMAATSALDIDDGRGKARIARERLHVLHVNHQLRGMDAEEDEEFVCDLAARYGVPCTVRRVDVAALAASQRGQGGNVEGTGREVRYAAAVELANQLSAEFGTPRSAARILTAHTANDRAETFFMNAVRGSGPAGLSSIPRRRNRIVRPLLDRTHEELCEYLRMRGIVWREDETNNDTSYLRAYVRHELMPIIERRNPRVTATLAATCDILSDEDAYLTQVAASAFRDLVRYRDEGALTLDAARLAATEVAIARRVVRQAMLVVAPDARLEARHIAAVLTIVAAGKGQVMTPLDVEARVEHGLLFVRSARAGREGTLPTADWLEVPPHTSDGDASEGLARLELADGRILTARIVEVPAGSRAEDLAKAHAREWEGRSVLLDAAACGVDAARGGRLWVDVAAPGDVMCPLGMHGQSKKLSDLLNETRLPLEERQHVPVVRTSPTGSVIWVAGVRPDERARCTAASRLLLELTLDKA